MCEMVTPLSLCWSLSPPGVFQSQEELYGRQLNEEIWTEGESSETAIKDGEHVVRSLTDKPAFPGPGPGDPLSATPFSSRPETLSNITYAFFFASIHKIHQLKT